MEFADRLSSITFVASASGLLVPEPRVPPRWVADESGLLHLSAEPWDPAASIYAPITAEEVGLAASSFEDVLAAVRGLYVEQTLLLLSLLATALHHDSLNVARQIELAEELFPPQVVRHMRRITSEPGRVVFDLRVIAALQRLVIVYGLDEDAPEPLERDAHQRSLLAAALLATGSVLPDGAASSDDDLDGWTAYLVRNGAWHDDDGFPAALARSTAYVERHEWLTARQDASALRCPLDDWMREDHGLTYDEQLAVGLAVGVVTKALDSRVSAGERQMVFGRAFLDGSALQSKVDEAVHCLSADRVGFIALLGGEDAEPFEVAWNHGALEYKPVLRMRSGGLLLLSSRSLAAWMTRWFHHRCLNAAKQRRHADRRLPDKYLTYRGVLGEEVVRASLRGTYRELQAVDAVRIHGEVAYGSRSKSKLSCDAALDLQTDLVLFEVYSGHMSVAARSQDRADQTLEFVNRAVAHKIKELEAQVSALVEGDYAYERLDLARVERIWPLVVLAGDPITKSPLLSAYLRSHSAPPPSDERVQPVRLVSLTELDLLLALVESGESLPGLLQTWAGSPQSEASIFDWIRAQQLVFPPMPSYARGQFRTGLARAAEALYPGSSDRLGRDEADG